MSNIKDKEFKMSSWAIDNKFTIYVMIFIFFLAGTLAYMGMPRESFPEIKDTKIYISVVYPGNTAEDIERLIIDPLEDKLKGISHVKKIESSSQEDYGMITLEFTEKITIESALQKVKDEVDKEVSSEDWPTFNGAKVEPNVFDITISEFIPILNVNIAGNYPTAKLKEFAEQMQKKIESLPEIKEATIRGAQEKEVEVAIDMYKMMASRVSIDDVINAIGRGNVTMSAGNLISSGQRRTIRLVGEIEKPEDLKNFVVKSDKGIVLLGDIAQVSFRDKDRTTYAREFGQGVVMLDVKKRSGENMIQASEKIKDLVAEMRSDFPKDLSITIANDQSQQTENMVSDLSNNVIFGVILVVGVLMFFLGFRNALFVGFAIPMSMFMSFMIINALGYTLNTMILFGLIMGLGMLVDNGIVVVENVFRLMEKEGMSRYEAAKAGIGEVAVPIIISTLTTVGAFLPLGMWPGVMGDFMVYFPLTLSIVLGSSLFVAIFFNSMLVSEFMDIKEKVLSVKQLVKTSILLFAIGTFMLLVGGAVRGLGTVLYFTIILLWAYKYIIKGLADSFQQKVLTRMEDMYEKTLRFTLRGKNPYLLVVSTFALLVLSFVLFGWSVGTGRTSINFFPDNKPNQIIVYIEYPEGTDIEKTNAVTQDIEKRMYAILNSEQYKDGDYNFMVESAVAQVGEGAGNPYTDGASAAEMPNRGKITVTLREFKYRRGQDSEELRAKIQSDLRGVYPGVSISVEKDQNGPPAGHPINIELRGEDYGELITTAERMRDFISQKNIAGIDELKIDVNKNKPAIEVEIDRVKAGELGVSVGQISNQLRRSVFGEKAGVYKEKGDDYDIYVRFNQADRHNPNVLFDQHIIFRDANTGEWLHVPISSVTKYKNTSSFSTIKHNKTDRVVTLYSALSPGFNDAGAIVRQIQGQMKNFDLPANIKIDFTGQIEEQNKEMAFLSTALLIAVGLIVFLLVYQFNSIVKPTLIFITILLSFTGVFLGLIITGQPFVILMTMMGIISLAGIVVNNGVVLLDYTQLLIDRKKEKMGLAVYDKINNESVYDAIVAAGKARLRPVLLTAITTVLGLIPLAIGFNINFFTLFDSLNPNIYFGGDNVIFWGPLAWTVIYGLVFSTFLTLVVVPVMFYLTSKFSNRFGKVYQEDENGKVILVERKG
ncbi:efflux RND transporter permease subunit [Capnocytophaga felis]|uniref:Copper transporter n=1 Tax=Capnocytophaga felis TaxID=2267611 RepID=A0A5M4B7H1_9FLAO|nr:efflux RND transporter permease subunit [Capnocytophaga felis]GET45554.1 copper transporter [Capnocytophaga felis]